MTFYLNQTTSKEIKFLISLLFYFNIRIKRFFNISIAEKVGPFIKWDMYPIPIFSQLMATKGKPNYILKRKFEYTENLSCPKNPSKRKIWLDNFKRKISYYLYYNYKTWMTDFNLIFEGIRE